MPPLHFRQVENIIMSRWAVLVSGLFLATPPMFAAEAEAPAAKKKAAPESPIKVGMVWTGTFSRTTPDKLNGFRVNKQFHGTDTDPFHLRVDKVEGNRFAGTIRFDRIQLEYEAALRGKAGGFELRFTKILKGRSALVGALMIGEFGADAKTVNAVCKNLENGRSGVLDGKLQEESGKKKGGKK